VGAGPGGGRIGGIPSWLLFGGLGAVVIATKAIVAIIVIGGNGGDPVQVVIPPPTSEPTLASIPTSTIVPPTVIPVPVELGVADIYSISHTNIYTNRRLEVIWSNAIVERRYSINLERGPSS